MVNFADLIANDSVSGYSPGGVQSSSVQLVSNQGPIVNSTVTTNIAISGTGLFPVTQTAVAGAPLLFTRSGSFAQDKNGVLVNGAGYFLQGWKVDSNGALPASLTAGSLVPVQVQNLTEAPQATSTLTIQANLQSSQPANTLPYLATDATKNMASGTVTPQFTIPVSNVIDSGGVAHSLTAGFLKTANNTWAVEVYAQPATDVTNTGTTTPGQVATGTLTFNGDGTLASVSAGLQSEPIAWKNGNTSNIAVNWGTAGAQFGTPGATVIGKLDGVGQLDSTFSITSAKANGFASGHLKDISIDENGYVIGNFDNNTTQNFYKIPLAQFRNPDALQSLSANVYEQTFDSGSPVLFQAGQIGGTTLVPGSLEQSTVDQATQLSDLIVAQRAYDSNSKTVSVTDAMLQTLNSTGTT